MKNRIISVKNINLPKLLISISGLFSEVSGSTAYLEIVVEADDDRENPEEDPMP